MVRWYSWDHLGRSTGKRAKNCLECRDHEPSRHDVSIRVVRREWSVFDLRLGFIVLFEFKANAGSI